MAPFAAAIIAPFLVRVLGHYAAWVLAAVPAAMFYHYTGFLGQLDGGLGIAAVWDWWPGYGWPLSYLIDGLSVMFALLITGIGTFIILYSGGYLKGHPQLGRFMSFMFLFMGAMQGLVVSDNLITMFIFWELTSITSFLLIGFNHTKERSRRAAIQALVVTGGGGLSLMAGVILVQIVTGTTDLSVLLTQPGQLQTSEYYVPILLLFLGGAFTKSAQFPLHFWLPNAMEAPTPVSAYLHSATMVKAGVYLLMRTQPILGDTMLWSTILPLFGGVTLLVGTVLALRQTDLKLMLAYTTVASLGLLVMLVGTSNETAIKGAVIYLFAHSLFKGTLFMVAGVVDHGTGTREVTKLKGLWRKMPITFGAAALAAFSMAGLIPFIGFVAKEELYSGIWDTSSLAIALTITAVLGNALMLVIAFVVAFKPFWGSKVEAPHAPHEGSILLLAGPVVLSLGGLAAGFYLHWVGEYLIGPMTSSVVGTPLEANLHLVPTAIHANLILSVMTIILGLALFSQVDFLRAKVDRLLTAIGWGPDKGFDQFMSGLVLGATAITRRLQSGRLDIYMKVVFVMTAIALLAPMAIFNEWPDMPEMPDMMYYEWGIIGIAVLGLGAVLNAKNRLTAIAALGIQGFAVALLFMLFGAPDLSFTQFMVETLSVVILALVMTRLSLYQDDHRPMALALVDGTVALLVGFGFFVLLLAVSQQPFNSSLSDFFREYSVAIAHGHNIVNVILVDFRGVDTLGEISVVAITGLAILALVRIRHKKPSLPKALEANVPSGQPAQPTPRTKQELGA
ncbi:MAG: putative monovalent cation/H+ antiporter subunit A [Rhizobiales bacterium]|nr:putative monovalent cation/H+ antiporter subunit A [Hyphomicrobiales bacterium]